jgi:hypothetical protein
MASSGDINGFSPSTVHVGWAVAESVRISGSIAGSMFVLRR